MILSHHYRASRCPANFTTHHYFSLTLAIIFHRHAIERHMIGASPRDDFSAMPAPSTSAIIIGFLHTYNKIAISIADSVTCHASRALIENEAFSSCTMSYARYHFWPPERKMPMPCFIKWNATIMTMPPKPDIDAPDKPTRYASDATRFFLYILMVYTTSFCATEK